LTLIVGTALPFAHMLPSVIGSFDSLKRAMQRKAPHAVGSHQCRMRPEWRRIGNLSQSAPVSEENGPTFAGPKFDWEFIHSERN
jgi:hypothetical protein